MELKDILSYHIANEINFLKNPFNGIESIYSPVMFARHITLHGIRSMELKAVALSRPRETYAELESVQWN